jgi:DNA polymerase-3 subunit delta'
MDPLSRIIGHEGAKRRLSLMLKSGNVPHAILLSGPRHVGKAALAMAAARALLGSGVGEQGSGNRGQGADVSTHPDFRLLERGRDPKTDKLRKQISIDGVRELCAHLRLTPFLGGRKVAVIDGAETFSEEAGNAILKTLEEPPEGSHLILIAHSLDAVLPTVRSRSALLTLGRVPETSVRSALLARGASPAHADRAARYAGGRPGLAIRLTEDTDMLEWYAEAERRWRELRLAPLHRRFSLVADLAPASGDREEAAARIRDTIGFWEEAARRELREGSASAAPALRGLFRLRKSLETNVNPRLLLERFALELA